MATTEGWSLRSILAFWSCAPISRESRISIARANARPEMRIDSLSKGNTITIRYALGAGRLFRRPDVPAKMSGSKGGTTMQARAVITDGKGNFSVESIEVGDPQADEVQVEIKASGVCHTDHKFMF